MVQSEEAEHLSSAIRICIVKQIQLCPIHLAGGLLQKIAKAGKYVAKAKPSLRVVKLHKLRSANSNLPINGQMPGMHCKSNTFCDAPES